MGQTDASRSRRARDLEPIRRGDYPNAGESWHPAPVPGHFNNAYLPYRDPETLRAFLKVINEFIYDHSERLGDAFEYLLSVLGSQGDAGQFRTPRHIIDFIVSIVDPKKDDVVLDPACGTAGFLISSYKHILSANAGEDGASTLTPDDRGRLAVNFKGYDISPDMVRLSLVNMYLHGFVAPQIFEYDTLTSEDRWNEYADVILANPPFMSPKGGIRPHNRFSVKSKRSEVLFVDYMAEHLTPNGGAGIIVPEGIIFQSQKAHTRLRKMLVEGYLVAVVSLPGGVFNPYSGVKTSILILDKELAKKTDRIAFFKVENDGFDLGAQRRPIDQNDLPRVESEVAEYLRRLRSSESLDDLQLEKGLIVKREKVSEDGDYNLSGERYRDVGARGSRYAVIRLGQVVEILDSLRRPITKHDRKPGPYPYYGATGVLDYIDGYLFDEPLVLVGEDGAKWGPGEQSAFPVEGRIWVNNHAHVLRPRRGRLLDRFLIEVLNEVDLAPYITGVTVPKLNQKKLKSIQIPLPPLDVQKEIVAEIEGYQKVIDGARAVVENYRPQITIDPEWPLTPIGDLVDSVLTGLVRSKAEQDSTFSYKYIKMDNITSTGALDLSDVSYVDATPEELTRYALQNDDYLYNTRNSPKLVGKSAVYHGESRSYVFNNNILRIRFDNRVLPDYVNLVMNSECGKAKIRAQVDGTTGVAALYQKNYLAIKIPLAPLPTQRSLVGHIQAEQTLVNANRELMPRFERKIQEAIARVWGPPA